MGGGCRGGGDRRRLSWGRGRVPCCEGRAVGAAACCVAGGGGRVRADVGRERSAVGEYITEEKNCREAHGGGEKRAGSVGRRGGPPPPDEAPTPSPRRMKHFISIAISLEISKRGSGPVAAPLAVLGRPRGGVGVAEGRRGRRALSLSLSLAPASASSSTLPTELKAAVGVAESAVCTPRRRRRGADSGPAARRQVTLILGAHWAAAWIYSGALAAAAWLDLRKVGGVVDVGDVPHQSSCWW